MVFPLISALAMGGMAAYCFEKTREISESVSRSGSYPRGCSSRLAEGLGMVAPCQHAYCALLRNAGETPKHTEWRHAREAREAKARLLILHALPELEAAKTLGGLVKAADARGLDLHVALEKLDQKDAILARLQKQHRKNVKDLERLMVAGAGKTRSPKAGKRGPR